MSYHDEIGNKFNTNALMQSNVPHLSPANHVNASNHLHTLATIQQQAAMLNRGGRIEPPKVIQGFVPGRPISRVSMAPNATLGPDGNARKRVKTEKEYPAYELLCSPDSLLASIDLKDFINSTLFGLLSSEEKNNLLQYLPEIDALTEGNVKCLFRNSVFRQNITLFQSMLKTGKLATVPKSFVQNPPPVLSPEPVIYYPMKPLSLEQVLRQPRLIRFKHDQEYLATFEKYVFQDDELDEDFALLLKQYSKDKKLLEKVALEDFGLDQKKKRPRLTLITNSNRKFPPQMPNPENLNHNVNMNMNVMSKFNIHEQEGNNHFHMKNHNNHHLGSGYPMNSNHMSNQHTMNQLTSMQMGNMNSANNAMKKQPMNRGSLSKQFDSIQQSQQYMGRDAMNSGNPNNFQQSSMMSNQMYNSNMRSQQQDNRLKVRERTPMDNITLHNYVPNNSHSNSSSNLGMNHGNQSFQLSQGNRNSMMGKNSINLVHETASNIHPSLLSNHSGPGVGSSGLVRTLSDSQLSNPAMRTNTQQQQQEMMQRKLSLMRSAPESMNGSSFQSGSSSQLQNYQSNVSKPMQLTDYSNTMLTPRVGGMQSLSIQAKIQQQQQQHQQNQLLQQQAQAKIQQQHQQLMQIHQLHKQQQNQHLSHQSDTPLVKSMAMPKSLSFPHLQMNNSNVQSNSNGNLNSSTLGPQQNSAVLARADVKGPYDATNQSLNGSFRMGANFAPTSTTQQSGASPLNSQQPPGQVPKVIKFVSSPSPVNSTGSSMNNTSHSGNATSNNLNFIHFQNNNSQGPANSLTGKPMNPSNFIDLSSKFIVNSTSGALSSNSSHVPNNGGSVTSLVMSTTSMLHPNNQQKSASDSGLSLFSHQNQSTQSNPRILSTQSHMLPGSFPTSATQQILNQQQQLQTMGLPKPLPSQLGTSSQSSMQMLQPGSMQQNSQQQSQHAQHNQQYQQQLMLMQQKQQHQSQIAQQQQQLAQQQQQNLQYNRQMNSQQSHSSTQQAQLMTNQLQQSQASPRTSQLQQQVMYQQLQNSANQSSLQSQQHQNSLFPQSSTVQQHSRPLSQSAIQQPNLSSINQQLHYTNVSGSHSQQPPSSQQPNSTQHAYSQHLLQQHQQQQAQLPQFHNQQQLHNQQQSSMLVQNRPGVAPEQIQQLIQTNRGLQHRYKAYDDDELPLKSDFFFYPSFEDKKIEELVYQVLKAEGTSMHAQSILNAILRQMPSLANHSCPAQMLAATICNYIKSNPSATPFVKTGPMLFALKDSQMQGQEKPTPLANPHFV